MRKEAEYVHVPAREPGNGAPLFHGVRVIELSTVVAAPTGALPILRMKQ